MNQHNREVATLAGGCFWCLEAVFNEVEGIEKVTSGYTGGTTINPTYEEVCTDTTGHAEAVQVEYDPNKVSYQDLLEVFWSNHDPTSLNRQGPDIGIQYRSAIFFHDDEQKKIAEKSKEEIEKSNKFSKKIVTEITPAPEFYKAEEYHQKYFQKHGLS